MNDKVAKKKILEFSGQKEEFDYLDILEVLDLDLIRIVALCDELVAEGKIEVIS